MKYIVSEEHRFVYFVTPKVACSSIKAALMPIFSLDMEKYSFIDRQGRKLLRPHKAFDESPFQLNKKQYLDRESDFRSFLRFGFVRNPWDRLFSCYRQKLIVRKKPDRKDNVPLKGSSANPKAFYLGMPFAEFIERVCEIPDKESDQHFRSQSNIFYARKPEERCLASFIGRFETLGDDFSKVMSQLGLSDRVTLGHTLRSRNRKKQPYTDYYDERLRRLVADRFSNDIRLFGYAFDE